MNALILALMLAGGASSMSSRILDPMVPVIAIDLGRTLHEVALLVTAANLPYAIMQLALGAVSDAFGKGRVILVCTAFMTLGLAACALAPDYGTLFVGRIVAGAFAGGIFPVALALVGDRTSVDQRQYALARLLTIALVGQLVGASLGGILVDSFGWRFVFALNAAIGGVGWIAALLVLRSGHEPRRPVTFGSMFAGYRAALSNAIAAPLLVVVLIEGMISFGLFPFVASMLIARQIGGSFEAGLIIGAFSIGGVVYTLVVRRMIALLGERRMITGGAVLVGVAYVATAAPLPWQALALLYFIAGFGYFMMHNTLQTRATELAPAARGACIALFAGFLVAGSSIGPVMGSFVSDLAGYHVLFAAGGLLYTAAGFYIAEVFRRRRPAGT